jgi:hypothetical protein
MANQASNKIKYELAIKAIDFVNDTFRIILMQAGFTFDKDGHHAYADVSALELPTGNGYTVLGKLLTGVAVVEDDTNDRCGVTWANTSWTAVGGPIGPSSGAIIYDSAVSNFIVGYIDFGGTYTQADGGTATLSSIAVYIS